MSHIYIYVYDILGHKDPTAHDVFGASGLFCLRPNAVAINLQGVSRGESLFIRRATPT